MGMVGTTARGIRAPLIKSGDDIVQIVVDSILTASKEDGFELRDRDIIGITEAVVARAQGNYASCKQSSGRTDNKRNTRNKPSCVGFDAKTSGHRGMGVKTYEDRIR